MFNVGIDDLVVKPYTPHKSLLQWICCKCLAWWQGHSYFWPQRSWRLLEAKNTPRRPKKAWNISVVTYRGLKNRISSLRLILQRNCCVVRHDRRSQLLLVILLKESRFEKQLASPKWLLSVRTVVRLWQLGIQNHGFRHEPFFKIG